MDGVDLSAYAAQLPKVVFPLVALLAGWLRVSQVRRSIAIFAPAALGSAWGAFVNDDWSWAGRVNTASVILTYGVGALVVGRLTGAGVAKWLGGDEALRQEGLKQTAVKSADQATASAVTAAQAVADAAAADAAAKAAATAAVAAAQNKPDGK